MNPIYNIAYTIEKGSKIKWVQTLFCEDLFLFDKLDQQIKWNCILWVIILAGFRRLETVLWQKKKTLKKLQRLTYSVTMEAGNFYQNFYYYLSWQLTAKKFLQWQLLILNTSEPIPFTFNLLSSLRTLISVLLFRIQSLYSYNYSSMTMKYWFILTLRF